MTILYLALTRNDLFVDFLPWQWWYMLTVELIWCDLVKCRRTDRVKRKMITILLYGCKRNVTLKLTSKYHFLSTLSTETSSALSINLSAKFSIFLAIKWRLSRTVSVAKLTFYSNHLRESFFFLLWSIMFLNSGSNVQSSTWSAFGYVSDIWAVTRNYM